MVPWGSRYLEVRSLNPVLGRTPSLDRDRDTFTVNGPALEDAARAFADPDHPYWAFGDAADAVRPVLNLPAEQRNAGIIYSARRVRGALSRGRSRNAVVARQFSEEIASFSRPPLALRR
ncbi:hypothetical protein [Peterkaempfera griseoplana]|uniref:hypothetical protein n=1 Tax=Peterkaempfera griseoplana TaxID=66896 RepID=UPI0006E2A852|nr:hypothetical protein [Peterkaempfera griseoplana]